MSNTLDRDALLDAFDEIGRAAVAAGTRLQIAVYGGSALMLASNFRFATEDVDVSELERTLAGWLEKVVKDIARQNGWADDWLNDGVAFHLSFLADGAADHLEFGTFPRDGTPPGLVVSVPTAEYLLALKLKAARINDPLRGEVEPVRWSRDFDGGRSRLRRKAQSGAVRVDVPVDPRKDAVHAPAGVGDVRREVGGCRWYRPAAGN